MVSIVAACSAGGGSAPKAVAPKPSWETQRAPEWTEKTVFYDRTPSGGFMVYGVGTHEEKIPPEGCTNLTARGGMADAERRAYVELNKYFETIQERDGAALVTRAAGYIYGAQLVDSWYDGEIYYAAVRLTFPDPYGEPTDLDELAATGGVPIHQLEAEIRAAGVAKATANGFCADPHERPHACCGSSRNFCHLEDRFSVKRRDGSCRCGYNDPCMYDFKCRQGDLGHECVCEGGTCPCGESNCAIGFFCNGRTCERN
jgi:hypothetical protein